MKAAATIAKPKEIRPITGSGVIPLISMYTPGTQAIKATIKGILSFSQ
jgi:hypothetical protein